jgi:hypothetical protein
MKTLTLSLIALVFGTAPVKAQIFQPNIVNGAIFGGIAGAIIGNNSGHHAGEGALIGSAAGAAIGSLAQPQPTVVYVRSAPVEYATPAPVVYESAPVVVESSYTPVCYDYYGYGYRPSFYPVPYWGIGFGWGWHDRDREWRGDRGWHDRDGGRHRH